MKRLSAILLALLFVAGTCTSARGVSITGTLSIAGGPLPPNGNPGPRPLAHSQFHVIGAGKDVLVTTDKDGVFNLRLQPGAYRVVVGTPGHNADVVQPQPNQIIVTTRGPNRFALIESVP